MRERILPQVLSVVSTVTPNNKITAEYDRLDLLVQFLLDCTSLNLDNSVRININQPGVESIFSICSDYCYAVHRERTRKLSLLGP